MAFLTCRDFADFLDDYFDAALPREQRAKFDAHLAVCPPCVAYLKTYRATMRLAKEACGDPAGPVSPDVPEELIRAILKARGKS